MSDGKANKEEYPIFKDHAYMIELDGTASVRKMPVKGGGFVRYPFQLAELDVAGYIKNVGRITQQKSRSRTLDFSLANSNDDEVSLSQAAVHTDYSQAKEGTLQNLFIWDRNKINDVSLRPLNAESRLMASGHERDGTSYHVVMRNSWPELDVFDKTASTVVVIFDEPATQLVKYSVDSLAATDEDVGLAYADDVGLPRTLENIIGTTQALEIKSHTYYEHGTFESFTYWRIASKEVVEEDAKSSNANTLLGIKAFMKLLLLKFVLLLLSYT
nr:hypothetical protein [Tanacetum cinerariifolium]